MTPQHPSATSALPHPAPVTVLGLGPMGVVLAATLLDNGHPVTVWNRTPHKGDALVTKGAHRAATVAEAVSASPVTIVCLKDYATMYAILDPAPLRGRTLVNLNSGTPAEAHAAARWAAGHGIDYLDGAIMVQPQLVGRPDAVFLYSGPQDVFDRHQPTLTTLGDPRHLGPDPSLAVLYNTALLDLMYATLNGFLHATALVGTAGVSAAKFADLAVDWFMPTVVTAGLTAQAPDLDNRHYPGDFGTLEMNLNALEHITTTSIEQGVHAAQPHLMKQIAEQAIAEGHGDKNYLAVFEVLKNPTHPQ
ncbi:NAD(P)-dependent oxidoreductase [Spongiactinospora rosea]|uniref:NAD(P)-dependent oxidoreductase n=1 Tax=Spongiactinospora rosea TaxID=2248750 RepID=A0A366M5L3_9ACTN|nr:NAD(P)-binding domain-containing protein [Spongiactinospora rosea]RBQ21103.1 NAD(P)-dependent oxidoreductase [Spongiactinospora rosea]